MDNERSHINPQVPAELIRRYFAGELDDAAMHALEKQALSDPFLAEALEGFGEHPADQRAQLADLEARLAQRMATGEDKEQAMAAASAPPPQKNTPVVKMRRFDYRWAVAAAVLVLLAAGGYEWLNQGTASKTPIAQEIAPPPPPKAAPVGKAPDSVQSSWQPMTDTVALPSGMVASKSKRNATHRKQVMPEEQADVAPAPSSLGYSSREAAPALAAIPAKPKPEMEAALANAVPGLMMTRVQQDSIGGNAHHGTDTLRIRGYAVDKKRKITGQLTDESPILSLREEAKSHAPSIQGVVVDENSQFLPGVVVRFKGSPNAVQTNMNGYFNLPATSRDSAQKVELQFIGYDKIDTMLYASAGVNSLMLKASSKALYETVVVAGRTGPVNNTDYQAPSPTPGYDSLHRYLDDHLQNVGAPYGRLRIIFTVTPTGKLENFKVLNGVSDFVDQQVIELLKEGPAWKPASDYRPAKVKLAVKVPGPKK